MWTMDEQAFKNGIPLKVYISAPRPWPYSGILESLKVASLDFANTQDRFLSVVPLCMLLTSALDYKA